MFIIVIGIYLNLYYGQSFTRRNGQLYVLRLDVVSFIRKINRE